MADASSSSAIAAAKRDGLPVQTLERHRDGHGKARGQGGTLAKSAAKLDNETEDFHLDRVPSSLRTQITRARSDKRMTQAQLAQAINEKVFVVQDYENGKAIPNPAVLAKMSRVLGTPLKKA